ncbi:4466_t:CDS:2 [Entrophospora sp. SA101]|nr:4466_t:CDS:2 [Entrophospora sp. SA101]
MKKAHNGHLEKFAVVHITKNIQKDELSGSETKRAYFKKRKTSQDTKPME